MWTTEGDPARLDEEGAEIVIVGVADGEHDFGIDVLAPASSPSEAPGSSR